MSFAKSQLKLAKEAIGKKDYSAVENAASQVLDYEPDNYTAKVFLGLALLELREYDKSEQVYRSAIKSNPGQLLALQGISKFYERLERWDQYDKSLQDIIQFFVKSENTDKCAETVDKLIRLRRGNGNRKQLVDALGQLLPGSSTYGVLSSLPPPDSTNPTANIVIDVQAAIHNSLPVLEEMISLVERDEEEVIRKEIDSRRKRLGAPGIEAITKEVDKDILSTSRLPALYDEVLNHPNTSDTLRRETEAKLLRYKQRLLRALPDTGNSRDLKVSISKELDNLIDGAVLLNIPDELAWMLFLDSKDYEELAAFGVQHFKSYMHLFPLSSMASLLRGYFAYTGIELGGDEDGDEEDIPVALNKDEEPLDIILNAFSSVQNTIIANRIVAEVYLIEEDYENAIKISKKCLELLHKFELDFCKKLKRMRIGLQVILSTSLVHFYPPKHHPDASAIIQVVLADSPDNASCLMGFAYIMEAARDWEKAADLFDKVVNLLPGDLDKGLRAQEEEAWCRFHMDQVDVGLSGLHKTFDALNGLHDRRLDTARCLWRIGKCYWDMNDRENSYKYFINSLKENPSFAPAFTSLGIYYLEQASPPDPIRASKCFQKAFELDPKEADAAERLAKGFADDREWDLVEVIAKRTIEGEGGIDAGMKGSESSTARYLPTNAWAWKSLGVVELTRRQYPAAIQAFQVALRAEPEDQLMWLRLGEAYGKAGRYAAALKALYHALELNPGDWICSYFIGDVKQRMGLYKDAISILESILETRPTEIGILASLGRSCLELGRTEFVEGFIDRGESSLIKAVTVGLEMVEHSAGFRSMAWKFIADSLFYLSHRPVYAQEDSVRTTLQTVMGRLTLGHGVEIPDVLSMSPFDVAVPVDGKKVLEVAVFSYNNIVALGPSVKKKDGSAWYDLGIAMDTWISKAPKGTETSAVKEKVVECLNNALREQAGNDAYWVALGNAQFSTNAGMAQHAYIKALEIDSKNALYWTNLGLLYLHHNDMELAYEAFHRSQVLDPEYSIAWIGQALLAAANGDDAGAKTLLEHSVSLPIFVSQAGYEFSARIFDAPPAYNVAHNTPYVTLLPAFFVLERCVTQRPEDSSMLHLLALVCERLGQTTRAAELVGRAITLLERAYEEREDSKDEHRFVVACATLGRVRLALGDHAGVLEAFGSVLGLINGRDTSPKDTVTKEELSLRVQALFGSGIAHFLLGDAQAALDMFQNALQGSGSNEVIRGHVTVFLAQVMWAIGTEELKELAKTQLLECITVDPENLAAINTLAGMGILTGDDGLVDAALAEILALPLEERRIMDPQKDIDYLLVQHYIGQRDPVKALSVAQHNLLTDPSDMNARIKLVELSLQNSQYASALALLAVTIKNGSDERHGEMEAEASRLQAIAHIKIGEIQDALKAAQRAIILMPGELRGWQTLAYVRSLGVADKKMY